MSEKGKHDCVGMVRLEFTRTWWFKIARSSGIRNLVWGNAETISFESSTTSR
jgi:hypothetical protein